MPTPPYIKTELKKDDQYQTIYAKSKGAIAAPTAGLHFTKEVIRELSKKGIKIVYLTLHVGIGTFRPIEVKKIEDHLMEQEELKNSHKKMK